MELVQQPGRCFRTITRNARGKIESNYSLATYVEEIDQILRSIMIDTCKTISNQPRSLHHPPHLQPGSPAAQGDQLRPGAAFYGLGADVSGMTVRPITPARSSRFTRMPVSILFRYQSRRSPCAQPGIGEVLGGPDRLLDSDDEWLPEKLDTQLKIMQHHPEVQLLFTDFDNITEGRAKVRGTFSEYAPVLKLMKTEQIDDHCYFIRYGF